MNLLTVKSTYLPLLLLLLLWFGRCDSLNDSSLPEVFYTFGTDEGDSVVTVGDNNCGASVYIPYEIFNYATLYVSSICVHLSWQTSTNTSQGLATCGYLLSWWKSERRMFAKPEVELIFTIVPVEE